MSLRRSSRNISSQQADSTATDASSAVANPVKGKATSKARPRKASASEGGMKPPARPSKKRKVQDVSNNTERVPPSAEGPKVVAIAAYSTGDIDDKTPPPESRKASAREIEPHMTNAPLRTPRGTRITPRPQNALDPAVEQSPRMKARVTTANLLEIACAHLVKVDPELKTVIDQNPCRVFSPEGLAEEVDPFRSLVSGILAQQVSGAAANAIKNKFIALFNDGKEPPHDFPTPAQVAKTDLTRMRSAGLSMRKAEYIQGLAEKFESQELSAQMLADASDDEVLEKLIAVRGLGKWSVEMFMTFALKRMDVLSTGDLGVQRGMAAHAGRDVSKLKNKGGKWKYMSEQEMLDRAAPFSPYRSLFMWYMWRIEGVDVTAVQGSSS